MRLFDVASAELTKLRTLPLAVLAVLGTILVGVAISTALAADRDMPPMMGAAEAVLAAVPFMQAGFLLLGVIPAGHEHAGGQYRTTLAAIPRRGLLVAGKSIAALLALTATALLTIGASWAAAAIARHSTDAATVAASASPSPPWSLLGAAIYLVLIGMLAHALTLLVRHLVPALVTMLALVLVVPPLASGVDLARWLPSRAGGLLYLPDADPDLTAGAGALTLFAWIVTIGAAAVTCVRVRDA